MSAHAANPPAPVAGSASASPGRPWGLISLVGGLVFLAISLFGLFSGINSGNPRPFLGYLIGIAFWLSLLIGSLVLVILSHLMEGGWMAVIRRQLEHFLGGFKWMFLMMLPLLLAGIFASGSHGVPWMWMDPTRVIPGGETVVHDHLWEAKSGWLNLTAFTIRFCLYFVVWVGLSELLRLNSYRMDDDGKPVRYRNVYRLSAAGALLTALSLTFGSIDWFKSLNYHWFSTMYGVWFFAACVRSATCFAIVLCAIAAARGGLKGIYGPRHTYLLGCLLLAFTVFWAYISFAQYFLIYSANIPEETFWYDMREFIYQGGHPVKNSWWTVSMFLIFAHFLVPFILLLWNKTKFGWRIVGIALWILTFHILDLYWNILPQQFPGGETGTVVREFGISIWDVTTFIGVGGVCIWAYLSAAARFRPIPIRDPRIMESIPGHEH